MIQQFNLFYPIQIPPSLEMTSPSRTGLGRPYHHDSWNPLSDEIQAGRDYVLAFSTREQMTLENLNSPWHRNRTYSQIRYLEFKTTIPRAPNLRPF